MRIALAPSLVLCLFGATLVPAQDSPRAVGTDKGFFIEAGEHDLMELLDSAAKFLGRNYLLPSPQQGAANIPRGRRGAGAPRIQGPNVVRLQKKLILDAIACEEVVSQLAYSRGFLIVPLDALRGIYEVISMQGPRSHTLRSRIQHLSPKEVLRRARMRILVGTVVPLKYIPASSASQQLRPFFASSNTVGDLQFGTAGSETKLLLKGFAEQVAAAIRLLEKVDVPDGKEVQVENYGGQLGYLQGQQQQQMHQIKRLETKIVQLERMLGGKQLGGQEGTPNAAVSDGKAEAVPKKKKVNVSRR